ncbi:MAG TPA: NAD-dependent epimerase/dehydratase family protein [Thermoanaerobaculia bacterium]|nr:NAD-dependent epimerase/dehydratase family protein [Thermoanaerobaculia bacterium]
MRVLVTGGSGVIGAGLIPELIKRGIEVRLLSRGANEEAEAWPEGVDPFPADVANPETLKGAADQCDAVVHITGIVDEDPPDVTYAKVNVEGTANMLAEAERSGAPRFIYISSLGADRGESDYHRSKLQAEEKVRAYGGPWIILRPGNVYGPGDDVISRVLKMARSLPAIPVVGHGDQPFQPIWYEDLGRAIADSVTRSDLPGQTLQLAGDETVTTSDLVEKISEIVDRKIFALPIPLFAAGLAAKSASILGVDFPLTESRLAMLLEENLVPEGEANALTTIFGLSPLPLDEGLRQLATKIPEVTPSEGVGALERKRFWADIEGSDRTPQELMNDFRENYKEILPIDFGVEGDGGARLEEGETISAALPIRGHIQIRVEESTPTRITFGTIEGHPLAGIVQFSSSKKNDRLTFMVEVHSRAAGWFDFLAMKMGGETAQRLNWETVVERMVERSGGMAADGVQNEKETIDDEREETSVESWVERFVTRRRRHEAEEQTGARPGR